MAMNTPPPHLHVVTPHSSDLQCYRDQLRHQLEARSPLLLSQSVWDTNLIYETLGIGISELAMNPLRFTGLADIPALELKAYWVEFFLDPRKQSSSQLERRFLPMQWLVEDWHTVARHFAVKCIADIPYPPFHQTDYTHNLVNRHNADLLALYNHWLIAKGSHKKKQIRRYVKGNTLVKRDYLSTRITVAGDFHRKIVIHREQFRPLSKRNIIFLNDLYSEEESRYQDRQRASDTYLNLYRYPTWLREALRTHLLEKVTHGELGPRTLLSYFGSFVHFVKFLYETFDRPGPDVITSRLVDERFLAWGNKKELAGKNWFTHTVALLRTAAMAYPQTWPTLSISARAARKITNVHYKQGLGRLAYSQESAGRSIPKHILDDIAQHIQSAPDPVTALFTLATALGARAEDLHAILFNCLEQDPHDPQFMLLTFWQNKVRRWNVKPLLKTDPIHQRVIDTINTQRNKVLGKYKKATKYLFPSFTGSKESFIHAAWTLCEIKKVIAHYKIMSDNHVLYKFGWHQLRHYRGTEMAEAGHDILAIMMELGHSAPDMAASYVNNRLQLKKKALLEKGAGRFFTIEGKVDDKLGELLVRKVQMTATRVCGGVCTLPGQLGSWCQHANACLTCTHFRADEKDVDYLMHERQALLALLEQQENEIIEQKALGHHRMADIISTRQDKNKATVTHLNQILKAMATHGTYQGANEMLLKAVDHT